MEKPAKTQFIGDLKEGDTVDSIFVVRKKEVRLGRNKQIYLALELSDSSGTLPARMWERVEKVKSQFEEGDFAAIQGKVTLYRGQPEIQILALQKEVGNGLQFSDFLPSTRRDPQELWGFLEYFVQEIYNPFLKKLLLTFLRDTVFKDKFSKAPGAKEWHHAYLGGLLEHTVAVTTVCQHIGQLYPEVDQDLLVTAAILHDIGKVKELEFERKIDYTDAGKFLGHLIITEEMILEKIKAIEQFPLELALRLRHAILSHHGQLEWGSPKRPSTLEALILHHVDNLDAKISGYRELIFRYGSRVKWTDIKNLFKRPLHLPRSARDEEDLVAEDEEGYG